MWDSYTSDIEINSQVQSSSKSTAIASLVGQMVLKFLASHMIQAPGNLQLSNDLNQYIDSSLTLRWSQWSSNRFKSPNTGHRLFASVKQESEAPRFGASGEKMGWCEWKFLTQTALKLTMIQDMCLMRVGKSWNQNWRELWCEYSPVLFESNLKPCNQRPCCHQRQGRCLDCRWCLIRRRCLQIFDHWSIENFWRAVHDKKAPLCCLSWREQRHNHWERSRQSIRLQ